jgi:hypothetical protein
VFVGVECACVVKNSGGGAIAPSTTTALADNSCGVAKSINMEVGGEGSELDLADDGNGDDTAGW